MTRTSAIERLNAALARIDDPNGEGARAVLTVYRDSARQAAEAADRRAAASQSLGPLDGVIVTIKDLFDVKGEVTRAGSKLLAQEGKLATDDAPVVKRLHEAGAVIVGKTNMSEFAFSGLGTNPHFGTPGNPADRSRIPGGSTSGGAVAVTDAMCEIAIGSDTGGSTRIPAALCGIVGFKPSKQRVPTEGAFPLSKTLDSIGPMAKTVAQCAAADAVMAGEAPWTLVPADLLQTKLAVAEGAPVESLDDTVSKAFAATLEELEKAGVKLIGMTLPLLDDMAKVNAKGGLVPSEALEVHDQRHRHRAEMIDSNIAVRIERARPITRADYEWMLAERSRLARAMDTQLAGADALLMPTVPVVAPRLADTATPRDWGRNNAIVLRNTSIGNFFNLCAISLPMPTGGLPAGLMLLARNGTDRRLFAIAAAIERVLIEA